MRGWWLMLLSAGCGRFGFAPASSDATSTSDATDGPVIDAAPPPSCVALPPTCGPANDQPCCETLLVPGGTFHRGFDLATDNMYTDMTKPATISSFHLDRFEVTVARFRQFVDAGQGTRQNPPAAGAGAHPNINGSGWNTSWNTSLLADTAALRTAVACDSTWTDTPGPNENRPIGCIDWFEAMAFCAWDGGFLPTEAEWHFAASGGSEQRAYPWSSPAGDVTIDCSRATYMPCITGIVDVGSTSPAGDGKWRHADLGGNVMEWVLDLSTGYQTPCDDCANLGATGNRQARGGANFDDATVVRNGSRFHQGSPTSRSGGAGVRCARAP